jgi:hypothetical protein
MSSDGWDGWQLVPIIGAGDKWSVLVWKLKGEFTQYHGARGL